MSNYFKNGILTPLSITLEVIGLKDTIAISKFRQIFLS